MSSSEPGVNPYVSASTSTSSVTATTSEETQEPTGKVIGPPCLSLALLRWNRDTKDPVLFGGKVNLDDFPKLQQGGLRQFLKMISRAVVKNAKPDTRNMAEIRKFGDYRVFYYLRGDGVGAVLVTQNTYKARVGFNVIADLFNRFDALYPNQEAWRHCVRDMRVKCPFVNNAFARAQKASLNDRMSLAQEKADHVKYQLHKTLESVLAKGESLGELVKRSEDLSVTTKFFYKDSKKLNKCPCVVM